MEVRSIINVEYYLSSTYVNCIGVVHEGGDFQVENDLPA